MCVCHVCYVCDVSCYRIVPNHNLGGGVFLLSLSVEFFYFFVLDFFL